MIDINYILSHFRTLYEVPADLDIGYGTADRRVNIHDAGSQFWRQMAAYDPRDVTWHQWDGVSLPFLFCDRPDAPLLRMEGDRAFISDDLFASIFFFLSGWQEYVYMKDRNGLRYPYADSLQQRLDITHLPVVNHYFEILKTAVERTHRVTIAARGWGAAPFAMCLTHDIDKCLTGWRQDGFRMLLGRKPGLAAAILARRMQGNDSWFNFRDIIDLHRRYEARSSFYFIASGGRIFQRSQFSRFQPHSDDGNTAAKTHDPDYFFSRSPLAPLRGYRQSLENADYDLRSPRMRSVLRSIREAGFEVGIHGGFGSHLSAAQFSEEMARFPFAIQGGRFHFLNFDISHSFDILEAQGLQYDSTLGFAEAPGFRNGIATPFVPFNITRQRPCRLLEIPLIAMDATFRSYLKTPMAEIYPTIEKLMQTVARFQGCMTVLWHNPYFTPYKFAGWREIYERVLQEGKNSGAELLSGAAVCDRWRPHFAAHFDLPEIKKAGP